MTDPARYARHVALREIGAKGQQKLRGTLPASELWSIGLIYRQNGAPVTAPHLLPTPLQKARLARDDFSFPVEWTFDGPESVDACLIVGLAGISPVDETQREPREGQRSVCWAWRHHGPTSNP